MIFKALGNLSLRYILSNEFLASAYIFVLCTFLLFFEGNITSSPLKLGIMGLAPFLFLFRVPLLNRVLVLGGSFWFLCLFFSFLNDNVRFSTIGYLGMFIISFIVFYNLIHRDAFSFNYFYRFIGKLITIFGVVIILQQLAIMIGFRDFKLINLYNQDFLSITHVPSLSIEPSHTARILTVLMLAYIRCVELSEDDKSVTIMQLFSSDHRKITILFIWSMLTMGSGTAFIGLGLLSIYFVRLKTAAYIIPLLLFLVYLGDNMEIENMQRAIRVSQTVAGGGSIEEIEQADGSASARIIPLVNTFTKTDLTDITTWIGHGTNKEDSLWWTDKERKLDIVSQYGLIVFILSLILVYKCMIRNLFSIETLLFFFLFGLSLGNIFYTWGAMMVFSSVRYFQIQDEKGLLELDDVIDEDSESEEVEDD